MMEIELDLIINTSINQFKSFCERQNGIKSISLYRDSQIDRIFGNEIAEKIDFYFKNDVVYGCLDNDANNFDISFQNVAFVLKGINIDGENSKALVGILNTATGKKVKSLIKDKIPMQIVSVVDNTGIYLN